MMKKDITKVSGDKEIHFCGRPLIGAGAQKQEGWREELGGIQRNDLFNKKWAILWHFRALGLEDQKIRQQKGILSSAMGGRKPGSQSSGFKTAISSGGFKKKKM